MKKLFYIFLFVSTPFILSAQWSMVRFDEYNFFTKSATPDPATSVITGHLFSGGSFIMRTNDGGATWDSITISNGSVTYELTDLFFTDINNGYAGGTTNNTQVVLKTTDNGTIWNVVTPDPSQPNPVTSLSFTDPVSGYASDETFLYRTTDGGANWTTSTPGFVIKDIGFTDMANGYACGQTAPNAVVMKTSDGGQTWNTVLSATFPFFTTSSMQQLDVVNSNVVYCTGQYSTVLFRTFDGGLTWDTLPVSQVQYGIQDYDFISPLEGHLLSNMGEIFGTSDGGLTWTLEYAVASGAYGPNVFLNSISFSGTTGYVCGSNGLIKKYTEPTGLQQINPGSLNLYPNPVQSGNPIYINGMEESFQLKVYTLTGQCILDNEYTPNQQVVMSLASGNYFLEVISGTKVLREKIVVIN